MFCCNKRESPQFVLSEVNSPRYEIAFIDLEFVDYSHGRTTFKWPFKGYLFLFNPYRILESRTAEVELANEFALDGRRVILVDTPGLGGTTESDTEVLGAIGAFLAT